MTARRRKREIYRRVRIFTRIWDVFKDGWFLVHPGVYIYRFNDQHREGKK